MKGLKVKCPNCKRSDLFETTEKYLPDVTPNGSFVRSLAKYHIDWLTSSTTLASEMTCPECLAQLAPSGRLVVISRVECRPPAEPESTQETAGVEDQAAAEVVSVKPEDQALDPERKMNSHARGANKGEGEKVLELKKAKGGKK
ncbi:MAG: hypothetical protein ACYC5X_12070 [Syntrophales bacterium]